MLWTITDPEATTILSAIPACDSEPPSPHKHKVKLTVHGVLLCLLNDPQSTSHQIAEMEKKRKTGDT